MAGKYLLVLIAVFGGQAAETAPVGDVLDLVAKVTEAFGLLLQKIAKFVELAEEQALTRLMEILDRVHGEAACLAEAELLEVHNTGVAHARSCSQDALSSVRSLAVSVATVPGLFLECAGATCMREVKAQAEQVLAAARRFPLTLQRCMDKAVNIAERAYQHIMATHPKCKAKMAAKTKN